MKHHKTTLALRNGTQESKALVAATMLTIQSLAEHDPLALYELIMLARDRNHQLFGNTAEQLARRNLLEPDGTLDASLRNVILSATDTEGFNVILQSPVAT